MFFFLFILNISLFYIFILLLLSSLLFFLWFSEEFLKILKFYDIVVILFLNLQIHRILAI